MAAERGDRFYWEADAFDLTLQDIQGLRDGPLREVVVAAEDAWLAGVPERMTSVRCATAWVKGDEVRIVFRFPID